MKSHSVQRAHRVPGAELHAVVDVLAAGEAVLVHPHRRHQVRDEQHVHDEAGAVLRVDRVLADLLGEARRALDDRSRRCRAPTTISTSFITGTGREEVQPQHALGLAASTTASCAIGIDEVFEARIVPSVGERVEALEHLALDARVLDDRLDHQVAARRGRRSRSSTPPGPSAAPRRRRSACRPSRARATDCSMRPFERSQRRLLGLVERDVDAGARRRLRDARAHEARRRRRRSPAIAHGAALPRARARAARSGGSCRSASSAGRRRTRSGAGRRRRDRRSRTNVLISSASSSEASCPSASDDERLDDVAAPLVGRGDRRRLLRPPGARGTRTRPRTARSGSPRR